MTRKRSSIYQFVRPVPLRYRSVGDRESVSTLDKGIDELRPTRSQAEVAAIAGYKSPNIITLVKQCQTKVSIGLVLMMAKALAVDPAFLLRLTIEPTTKSSAR